MKRLVLSIITVLFCIISIAQVPESFNYQAIVRDGGDILPNHTVSYRFSIIKGDLPGTVVYTEKHSITTNEFGLVNLFIGKGTDKNGDFTAINWGDDTYSLLVEIDPSGGTTYVNMGTTQLLSVPYALHSKNAENGFASVYNVTDNRPVLGSDGSINIGAAPTDGLKLNIHGMTNITPGADNSWGTALFLDSRSQPGGISYGIYSLSNESAEGGGKLLISNDNDGSKFIIDKDGKVGLGNLNPAYDLDVSGDINFTGSLYKNGTAYGGAKDWSEITNKPTFATVATSGNYDDLSNKPYGNNTGDMLYWNGSSWVVVPVGEAGQILRLSSSKVPSWTGIPYPVVTTTTASEITWATATCGGNVISEGGAPMEIRGVVYSTSADPATADASASGGTGSGIFTCSLTGLSAATKYYAWAFVKNNLVTVYGNEISFTTPPLTLPVLTTSTASSITSITAISGGNITSDGGAPVTAKGICWSTVENPTKDDSKTNDGTGMGSFISNLTELLPNTTYFIRAYATNSVGTAYGANESFSTLSIPYVSTSPITSITDITAVSGGNVISEGTSSVAERGVCWSTSATPTVDDNKTQDGSGAGSFASNLTGLAAGNLYHVRAYAKNSSGTAYGNEYIFATTGTVSDISGNLYNTVLIGTQLWMVGNLKTIKFKNDSPIPLVEDNSEWDNLSTPGYCWYNNDISNKADYGALYNWYSVNTGNLCPTGWHVPSITEWDTLINYLGGTGTAGGNLKESGTTHWINNVDGWNESGFTALPGGTRSSGSTWGMGYWGYWWSTTDYEEPNQDKADFIRLDYENPYVSEGDSPKTIGFSVRCLKD